MENFLKKAIVFGANGLVGSSVVSILNNSEKVQKVIPSTRKDVNLFSFSETNNFIKKEEPNLVVIAAAKVEEYTQIILIDQIFFRKSENKYEYFGIFN